MPALLLATAAVLLPSASAADPNLISNGTFDSSTSGWTPISATLKRATDGIGGTGAALVSISGSPSRFSIVTAASSTTTGGVRYVANAFLRSKRFDTVCLAIEEWTTAPALVGSARSCVTATNAWQPFPQVAYVAAASGRILAVRAELIQAGNDDSFEVDNVTLTTGQQQEQQQPANTSPPTISGTPVVGQTLTAAPGTWSGTTPMSFAYRWQSSPDATTWTDVGSAQSYTPTSSDVDRRLRVVVTATNSAGSSSAASAPTAPVQPTGTPSTGTLCGTAGTAPPAQYDHVVWIWLENRGYDQIVGPPGSSAAERSPFVNGTLVRQCGLATNYHNITHPSLPNYIAATSGSTQGLDTNRLLHYSVPSLFQQVQQSGRQWRSYHEAMPQNCDRTSTDLYPANHNPALTYDPIASACAVWDVPLGDTSSGALARDLANDTLPAFAFVVPDRCNSTHDCPIATGDAWLADWVPRIVSSAAYRAGRTAIFVSWDEGNKGTDGEDCLRSETDTSCHIVLIAISPYTRPVQPSTFFSHYSLLRTTEELLGLPFLAHAADSSTASMRAAFGL